MYNKSSEVIKRAELIKFDLEWRIFINTHLGLNYISIQHEFLTFEPKSEAKIYTNFH